MNDTTEYAVLRRAEGEEVLDHSTVTTDIERVKRARDHQQELADYKFKKGAAPETACVLVMRTCTPWCEVCTDDPFKRKETT